MGKKILERFSNGIIKENPILVGMLGICSTLAVTTSAINGLGMGASTLIVLALSNLIISLLRNFIPNSGAGIVYDSVPENEYMEGVNKAKAVVEAIEKGSK